MRRLNQRTTSIKTVCVLASQRCGPSTLCSRVPEVSLVGGFVSSLENYILASRLGEPEQLEKGCSQPGPIQGDHVIAQTLVNVCCDEDVMCLSPFGCSRRRDVSKKQEGTWRDWRRNRQGDSDRLLQMLCQPRSPAPTLISVMQGLDGRTGRTTQV